MDIAFCCCYCHCALFLLLLVFCPNVVFVNWPQSLSFCFCCILFCFVLVFCCFLFVSFLFSFVLFCFVGRKFQILNLPVTTYSRCPSARNVRFLFFLRSPLSSLLLQLWCPSVACRDIFCLTLNTDTQTHTLPQVQFTLDEREIERASEYFLFAHFLCFSHLHDGGGWELGLLPSLVHLPSNLLLLS